MSFELPVSVHIQAFVISDDRPRHAVLVATAHLPLGAKDIGVVIVAGGNQIRAGSHRQFLKLARRLAADGYACLRFDLPGLGDSQGELLPFDANAVALRAAIDALIIRAPSVKKVVLWGLCDGATSAALYALADARVAGLVLANPWVRTGQVQAQALVKTYYRQRLVSSAFWAKLLRGKMGVIRSLAEWLGNWRAARGGGTGQESDLPERLKRALNGFAGPAEIIIAAQDLTGQEFLLVARQLDTNLSIRITEIDGADHTFSTQVWHERLVSATLQLLRGVAAAP